MIRSDTDQSLTRSRRWCGVEMYIILHASMKRELVARQTTATEPGGEPVLGAKDQHGRTGAKESNSNSHRGGRYGCATTTTCIDMPNARAALQKARSAAANGRKDTADSHAARPVSSPFGPSLTLVRSTIALHPPVYAIICGEQNRRVNGCADRWRESSDSRLGCGRQTIPGLLDPLLPR